MLCCTFHGYSIDTLDEDELLPCTLLFDTTVAQRQNTVDWGAQFVTPNPCSELPLHVAIMSSNDPGLVEELLFNHGDRMDMRMMGASKSAGHTALDLVDERALREVSSSGDPAFTPTIHQIISTVLCRVRVSLRTQSFSRTMLGMIIRGSYEQLLRSWIKQLSPLGARRPVFTMRYFLRLEWRKRGSSYSYDTYFNDLMSSARQGAIPTVSKPKPFMHFGRQNFPISTAKSNH